MELRRLRHALRICGAGLLLAFAAPMALAASDPARSSGASHKAAASAIAHRGAAHHQHAARPATHQATSRKQHKKDPASRLTTSAAASASRLPDEPSVLGPFSLGVETEQKVKRRSIRGGEYDPERDGDQTRGFRPPYLGFSLKAPLSW